MSKSSTEADYRTMSLAASEVVWLQNLLKVMGLQQQVTPLLLCDNLSAVCMSVNPMFHKQTKHFDVDYHYVRERVALKALEVKHMCASLQLADVFTKSLAREPFFKLRAKLGVSLPLTPSLRGSINNIKPMLDRSLNEASHQTKKPTTKINSQPSQCVSAKAKDMINVQHKSIVLLQRLQCQLIV